MKKIIITTLNLTSSNEAQHYVPFGNFVKDYSSKVHYAINAYLASALQKGDDVKVILLKTSGGAEAGDKNVLAYMSELNEINNSIGAKIEQPTVIETQFELDKNEFRKTYLNIVKELDYDGKIYSDITYGHKGFPILLMSVLQFAEKYYNAEIESIIYGKVEFDRDRKIIPERSKMFDFMPLYGLSALSNVMESSSAENAIKAIDAFFSM